MIPNFTNPFYQHMRGQYYPFLHQYMLSCQPYIPTTIEHSKSIMLTLPVDSNRVQTFSANQPTVTKTATEKVQRVKSKKKVSKDAINKKGASMGSVKHKNPLKNIQGVTENRNVLPNITSNILSFIRRINRSGKFLEKVIRNLREQENSKYTVRKFYAYQFYLKENLTDFKGKDAIEVLVNYLNPQSPVFSLEEQRVYNKICRILISYYLNQELFVDILSSNRVSRHNRKDYLRMKRYIGDILSKAREINIQ